MQASHHCIYFLRSIRASVAARAIGQAPARVGTLLLMTALALGSPALAHDYKVGDMVIDHPFAHPTPPGTVTGGVYLRALRNQSGQADRLVGASTPLAARIELHEMQMDGNVMRMRELAKGMDVPARAEVTMGPSSPREYHLMLIGLTKPLKEGDRFKVNLQFEKAGRIDVEVAVEARRAAPMKHGSDGMKHAH